jgi:rhamnose transport system permease protein
VNGQLVARGRVPPLIVTLATLSVFRGLAFALGGSNSVGGFPRAVLSWHRDNLLGLPVPFWLLLLLFAGVGIYLACTDGGRALYAVGSNEAAARLSGMPVKTLKFRVFLTSGLLAGLAAVLYAARNDTVRADIGAEYELLAITMVVLGGVSVSGGEGSLLGAALGFLTLIYIQNGLNLMQEIRLGAMRLPVRAELHGVVVAALLVGALLMDAGFKRRARGR